MQLTLHLADLEDMIHQNIFPENYYYPDQPVVERKLAISDKPGEICYHEMFIEGIHIAYGDMRLKNRTILFFESDFETIEMHFELLGCTETSINNISKSPYNFQCNQHNILYAPALKGAVTFSSGESKVLEINMAPSMLKKYLGDTETFKVFIDQIAHQNPTMLGRHNMPVTKEMMQIINGITNCNKSGVFKRMYLEAKVIELLLLQLEQFSTHQCNDFCSMKPADIEKIHAAREIMLKNASNPYSLGRLAHEAGTNEFTLKKGFKELFGTTVFGMLADLKMDEAREHLLNSELSLTEISALAGYQHPNHFSAAFKRKYGVTPGKFRTS